jgi:hypothetical protein
MILYLKRVWPEKFEKIEFAGTHVCEITLQTGGKTAKTTYNWLKVAFRDEAFIRSTGFQWQKRFLIGPKLSEVHHQYGRLPMSD